MKTWQEVVATPEYIRLSPEEKEVARRQYFDQVIAPRVPPDKLDAARMQFESDFKIGRPPKPADPTEGMSTVDLVRAGAGKAFVDTARGIGQKIGLVSTDDVAASRSLDAPLMRTTPGMAGNVAGNVAIGAPTAFVPGANTLTGSATLGALAGFAQPAVSAEEAMRNTLAGGFAGGGVTAAARAVPSLYAGLISPLTGSGRERMAMETIGRFARDPNAVLSARPEILVPGSMPTLAEATGDVGIAQLQRSLASASPASAGAQWEADVARNAARLASLRDLAKTPAELEAAETARRTATAPLYAKVSESEAQGNPGRTIRLIDGIIEKNPKRDAITTTLRDIRGTLFDAYPATKKGADAFGLVDQAIKTWQSSATSLKKAMQWQASDMQAMTQARSLMRDVQAGKVTPGEALEQLRRVRPLGDEPKAILKQAEGFLKRPDQVPTSNIAALQSASKNLGDKIAEKGPNGLPKNEAIVRELTTIKKSLDRQIAAAEPAYGQAQKTFAEMSKPIDQMKVAQKIEEKATSALPKRGDDSAMYGEQFARALRGDTATVKAATGFKRNKGLESVFNPDQMAKLKAIEKDLARAAQAQEAGKVPGSPTAQYIASQNLIKNILDPLGIPKPLRGLFAESFVDDIAKRSVGWVGSKSGIEQKIQERITELLLDPTKAAAAAKAYAKRQTGTTATLKEFAARALPPVSVGSGSYAAQE